MHSLRRPRAFEPFKTPSKSTLLKADTDPTDRRGGGDDHSKEVDNTRDDESVLLRSEFKKRRNQVLSPQEKKVQKDEG